MNVRWLTAIVLAGVLAGCATESRYERYARIASEAAAAPAARAAERQRLAEEAGKAREAAEKERIARAERAREEAERKAREAEKAMQEARRAQARAEAQAKAAQADAAAKSAAEAREREKAAEAAKAREEALRAAAEAKAAREALAREERASVAEARAAAADAAAPAPVAVVAPAAAAQADATVFSVGGIVLKPQDVVTVVLRGIPAPEQIEDQIDDEGNISLPLLGEVRAAGYNATDLEREIRRQYIDRKIYQNINVTVIVPSRFYFMQGEIRAPGRYQLVQAIRLSQAIAQAGGYTEFASKKATVTRDGQIFKKVGNTRKLATHPEDDILLEPGDIVEIKRSFW